MLYLDSADASQVLPLLGTGLYAGVTTNPLILDRAGLSARDLPKLHARLRDAGCRRFFAQATGEDAGALRETSARIAELGDEVVVKLVASEPGLQVARELADAGREVLVTAIYHPSQMLLAEAAGARWVAPYVGRATSAGRDGIQLVRGLAAAAGPQAPRILSASLRSVDQLAEVAAAGAHDHTVSIDIARAMLADELTVQAAADFETIAQGAEPGTPTPQETRA
ncbi:transaldolase family protein [Homoserinibacter sp. YIM 151385]|uniref:transaldolase family protein n=1 Tax=Homoserinibacter sp. YIM 151385 TaxID=2985506 RepID=UPI0022F0247D|nr:transaldolase family protein [Homoserinibacter sp. YIM 151385]WBU36994.1 hypothetical protein OF852_08645 [Homoserinibacter sp. YIM 151385]